jgi:GNAT superfamily N-acetyltransferase
MKIIRVEMKSPLWSKLADYAENCSWVAGPHVAQLLRDCQFHDWEAAFAAVDGDRIAGFCTLLETDYYPENRYFPWISSVFVGEEFRGARLSGRLVVAAEAHARAAGFEYAYIPSDMSGFYEAYGYEKIDSLVNYGGDTDDIFRKKL